MRGFEFAVDLGDRARKDLLQRVEGHAHITGQRRFDRLTDVTVNFKVHRLGISEANLGFVLLLAANFRCDLAFFSVVLALLRFEPNFGFALFVSELSEFVGGLTESALVGGLVAHVQPSHLRECLVELFRRAAAYPDTGARLYHWMQLAQLPNPRSNAECLMSGGPESLYYEWFAETIRSVAPRLEALDIISVAELNLATLADRLREEAVARAGCLTTPLIVSCSGERR